jgi:hypothetical protein
VIRGEVELKREADEMFNLIQAYVDESDPQPPEPKMG